MIIQSTAWSPNRNISPIAMRPNGGMLAASHSSYCPSRLSSDHSSCSSVLSACGFLFSPQSHCSTKRVVRWRTILSFWVGIKWLPMFRCSLCHQFFSWLRSSHLEHLIWRIIQFYFWPQEKHSSTSSSRDYTYFSTGLLQSCPSRSCCLSIS